MARGIFNTLTKMALAAERASRQQAKERGRLNKENERLARLEDQGKKQNQITGLNAQLAEQVEQLIQA
jgi:hypothetical protein